MTNDNRHLTQEELELFLPRLRRRDGAEEPDEGLRGHLETCGRCRERLEDLRSLDATLAGLPSLEPSPGFTDAVMSRVTLPAPWYRRLWNAAVERWLLATIAVLGAGATGGFGAWIALRPDVSLGGLAGLVLERVSALFWTLLVNLGRLLWESGLPATLRALAGSVELVEAAAAMGALTLTALAVGWLMVKLMTASPPRPRGARG